MEERNKPTAVLVNHGFYNDALSAASQKGMPGIRNIPETVPCESSVPDQIEKGVDAVMDDIIAALTKPLTAEEKSPKLKDEEKPSRIIFNGDLEEINRFFYKRGWTDGFPIIPPTEEKVAEMLTGTNLPADHLVAKIIPRMGKATVEKIAINAVMAGALPTYMPLLIAGVQAVTDPSSGFAGWGFSAGSWSPCYIINGPIRNDININCSAGTLSPGNIANAAIGRAMGLILKNIGGIRKGIEDMGDLGNPAKYCMVLGENEEKSPWEPLHVERGFKKEDSTVTVSAPNSYWQMLPFGTEDKGVISTLVHNIIHMGKGGFYIIMTPSAANILAASGWKKKDVIDTILKVTGPPGPRPKETQANQSALGMAFSWGGPTWLHIIVMGGTSNTMAIAKGWMICRITKKIELPPNWSNLVAKYKNIVPTYVKY
jgi:hypothetical protein